MQALLAAEPSEGLTAISAGAHANHSRGLATRSRLCEAYGMTKE